MWVWYSCVCLWGVIGAVAQPTQPVMRWGIMSGYGANLYSAQFQQLPGIPSCCPGFDGGRGTGVAVSLLAEAPWLPYAWLSGQLGYWTLSGDLWKQERIGNVALIGAQGDTVVRAAEVEHTLQALLGAIAADLGISSRFFGRFTARLGLTLGVLLQRYFRQHEQLVVPEGFVFAVEGSRRRNEYEGTIPNTPLALLGASFAVGYSLPVGQAWELVPTLHYAIFLNNLSSVSWKPSALRFGATVLYTVYPPLEPLRDTVYLRDTTTVAIIGLTQETVVLHSRHRRTDTLMAEGRAWYRTTVKETWHRRVPKPPILLPKVDLALPDASALVVEELEQEEALPLLPYIFFPEGSAELEQTRMRLLTPQEAEGFDEHRLPINTLQVYYHLLNVVGKRLQRFPAAELTITGCVNNVGVEFNNVGLARRRAEAVRDYFVRVWNIEPRRVQVRARLLPEVPSNPEVPDGREENQRVELSANLPEILAPLFLAEVGYVATPAMLYLRSAVQAETTLARWQLAVTHGGEVLYSRQGEGVPPLETAFRVRPELLVRGDSIIQANLQVWDVLGTESTAQASLSFRRLSLRQKRAERVGDERRERFALMLFEYDKATLTKDHRRLLPLIRQRLLPRTRVIISGYTDRTGDPVYNKRLSEQRCRAVWQALGIRGKEPEVRAIGNDILLYPNDLPEGRAYSRTVLIELLSPVE
ncbi:MAG: OmpA family protein [Candidatus Kapabacteria bacterium]|nr:OmpA family protein [Candidatus Kapabacteria bacterium]MDW8225096.1 OmpA family protein [Bacteroidota bacterium]